MERSCGATTSAWTTVDVHLEEPAVNHEELNHYDDSRLSEEASRELPVCPGEDIAMFYGLEVLDSDKYELISKGMAQKMVPRKKKEKSKVPQTPKKRKSKVTVDGQQECAGDHLHQKAPGTKRPRIQRSALIAPKMKSGHQGKSTGMKSSEIGLMSTKTSDLDNLQSTWTEASNGVVLHRRLCESLARAGFRYPAPIQATTLSATLLGRRNILGAAPTGSGKTLAFLLPIFQSLLETEDVSRGVPIALIVTPTRELATQIHREADKLLEGNCVCLVGGVALVKQQRLLRTKRPSIIVGTPGRLWAMISSGNHDHLNDLSHLRFLVIDEADRLTQDHCFPQLLHIFKSVNTANPTFDSDKTAVVEEDDTEPTRLIALPGVPREASTTMLSDKVHNENQSTRSSLLPRTPPVEDTKAMVENTGSCAPAANRHRVHRQTLVFSATLTLPFISTNIAKNNKRSPPQGGVLNILAKAHPMGETKVVDLSSGRNDSNSTVTGCSGVRLPAGLVLEQIKCTQKHKDSHLYAYLATTIQGSRGPSLVFCNSVGAVRRVGATLQELGFSVRILHSHMQQRARFKAVESLKTTQPGVVVVCTDVAARGLDIPSVASVIHYDVAFRVDTFVHRSGRTARGLGESAVGCSLSLVSSSEDRAQKRIGQALHVTFTTAVLEGKLLELSQERVNLASKIVAASKIEQSAISRRKWFAENAEAAEMEIDHDVVESEINLSPQHQNLVREAGSAKDRLKHLLMAPMRKHRYGKFLSTNKTV